MKTLAAALMALALAGCGGRGVLAGRPVERSLRAALPGVAVGRPHPGIIDARWTGGDLSLRVISIDLRRRDIELRPVFPVETPGPGGSAPLGRLVLSAEADVAVSVGGAGPPREEGSAVLDGRVLYWNGSDAAAIAIGPDGRPRFLERAGDRPKPGTRHLMSAGPVLIRKGRFIWGAGRGGASVNGSHVGSSATFIEVPQPRTAVCTAYDGGTVLFVSAREAGAGEGPGIERFGRLLEQIGCAEGVLAGSGTGAGIASRYEALPFGLSPEVEAALVVVTSRSSAKAPPP